MQARLYSVTGQVETLHTAARIYLRENKDALEIGEKNLSGDDLVFLEEYGLPMGFVPKTIFGQEMSLYINKTGADSISAHIKLSADSGLKRVDLVELTRMIGFYGTANADGSIQIDIPIDEIYSDIVLRNERDETVGFMVDLDMDNNEIDGINFLGAVNGSFSDAVFSSLFVTGAESTYCRAVRYAWQSGTETRINDIKQLTVRGTSTFQTPTVCVSSALSLSGSGTVNVGNDVLVFKIDANPSAPNFTALNANTDLFSSSSFAGPTSWEIDKSLLGTNVVFDAATEVKGSTIYGGKQAGAYYTDKSLAGGIVTDELFADTVLFHKADAVQAETEVRENTATHKQDIKIELAGVSVLPDVFVHDEGAQIDSNNIFVVTNPQKMNADENDGYDYETCSNVMGRGDFYSDSLSVNIVCQYLFWDRMDRLINYKELKKCMEAGFCH